MSGGLDLQTNYKKKVGMALGGHAGAGYATLSSEGNAGYERPWLDLGLYARLQLRFPIEVNL